MKSKLQKIVLTSKRADRQPNLGNQFLQSEANRVKWGPKLTAEFRGVTAPKGNWKQSEN